MTWPLMAQLVMSSSGLSTESERAVNSAARERRPRVSWRWALLEVGQREQELQRRRQRQQGGLQVA
jgi:hypothetical protein